MPSVMINRNRNGQLTFYIAKKDQEEIIVSLEHDSPERWGGEVALAFSCADKFDGDIESALYGKGYSPAGAAIELGDNEPSYFDSFAKDLCLRQSVLTCCSINYQEHFSNWKYLFNYTFYFAELCHQIILIV